MTPPANGDASPQMTKVEATMPIELTDLTAADRCDGCSAQAWARVWVAADSLRELLFCHHHFHANLPRLTELGSIWDDQSYRINAKLDVSA